MHYLLWIRRKMACICSVAFLLVFHLTFLPWMHLDGRTGWHHERRERFPTYELRSPCTAFRGSSFSTFFFIFFSYFSVHSPTSQKSLVFWIFSGIQLLGCRQSEPSNSAEPHIKNCICLRVLPYISASWFKMFLSTSIGYFWVFATSIYKLNWLD